MQKYRNNNKNRGNGGYRAPRTSRQNYRPNNQSQSKRKGFLSKIKPSHVLEAIGALVSIGKIVHDIYRDKKKKKAEQKKVEEKIQQHAQSMERDRERAKQKMEYENQKHQHNMDLLRAKAESKVACQKKQNDIYEQPEDTDEPEETVTLDSYNSIVENKNNIREEDLRLGGVFSHKGYQTGIVGQTGSGKTTWTFHMVMAVAKGEINNEFTSEWPKPTPIPTLYFALEQTKEDFAVRYEKDDLLDKTLTLSVGYHSMEEIEKKIDIFLEQFPTGDVLIVIDNMTKVVDIYKIEAARNLNAKIEKLAKKRNNSGTGTLTYWKVFHTVKNIKEGKLVSLDNVKGDGSLTSMTHEFIGINNIHGAGSNIRCVEILKPKLWSQDGKIRIYEYSKDKNSYRCSDIVDRDELLNSMSQQSESPQEKRAVGAQEEIDYALALEIKAFKESTHTWAETEKEFGYTRPGILKALSRHGLELNNDKVQNEKN